MSKLSSFPRLLTVGLLLAGSIAAQRPGLPGLPLVSPPVDHPALAGQPLMNQRARPRPSVPSTPTPMTSPVKLPKVDPATVGVKKEGKELKAAVEKVAALPWHKSLNKALAASKRTGRPVLLLQTLGDIDGFA